MKIYVIHENGEWVQPLRVELERRNLAFEEWFLDNGVVNLGKLPPEGVFYNRMSASSHTRGHIYGPELTASVLSWLEFHGRRVLNTSRALQLEVSKVEQAMTMARYGIRTPYTIAVVGPEQLVKAAQIFAGRRFITKHNRAGKGLGVRLFHTTEALSEYVHSDDFELSRDGVTLLQEYVESPQKIITRVEFIGGRFTYAVRVDTSQGFELCPADACQIGDSNCPTGARASRPGFEIIDGFDSPLIPKYERLLANHGCHVAAFEFIVDKNNVHYTYDLNTNTNYNSHAEAVAGVCNMGVLAEYLGAELKRVQEAPRAGIAAGAAA